MNFYTQPILVTARKPHKCTYCAEIIEKDENYYKWRSLDDGSWFTSKLHRECNELFNKTGDGEYPPYSEQRPGASSDDEMFELQK